MFLSSEIVIFALCLHNSNTLLSLSLIDTNLEEQLSRCILSIGNKYFAKDGPVIVKTLHMLPYHLATLLEHERQPLHGETLLRVLNSDSNWTFTSRGDSKIIPQSVVILLNSSVVTQIELLNTLFGNKGENFLHPKARYIIASINSQPTANITKRLAQLLLMEASRWFKDPKIVVVIPMAFTDPTSPVFYIFTWFRNHEKDPCAKSPSKITEVDRWVSRNMSFLKGSNLYPPEIHAKDMNGCPVVVVPRPMPMLVAEPQQVTDEVTGTLKVHYKDGVDIKIVETFAKIMNFKIVYVNRTANSVKDVYFGTVDLLTPYWVYTDYFLYFDATSPHFTSELTWFVPRGTDFARWTCIFRIFQPRMWILVALTFVLGSCVMYLFEKNQTTRTGKGDTGAAFLAVLNALKTHLGTSINEKFRRPVATFFFILWLFYCLQINTAYQSSLIGFLANPGQKPTIQNLRELSDSDIKLVSNVLYLTNNTIMNVNQITMSKDIQYCIGKTCNKRLYSREEMGIFCSRKWFETVVAYYIRYRDKPFYVPIEENVDTGLMSMILQSGSPLFNRLQWLIRNLKSAGLIEKWRKDVISSYIKPFFIRNYDDGPFVIRLSHLQGPFYLYLLGILVSSVSFVLEKCIKIQIVV